MDPNSITALAAAAWPVLQPYLPVLATKAAEKIGAEVPGAIVKLWDAVRKRFDGEANARAALGQLLSDPKNEKLGAVVEWQLEQLLGKDGAFRQQIQSLLPEAQAAVSQSATVVGDGTIVQGSGNVVAGAGGVIVQGNAEGDIITGESE